MTEREVWVTGIGLISSLGIGIDESWAALMAGETGAHALDDEAAAAVDCVAGASVKGFRAARMIKNRKSLKLMTRPVRLGVAAAGLAFEDAGLTVEGVDSQRLGVFVGAGQAFADRRELQAALDHCRGEGQTVDMQRFGEEGLPLIHPLWLLRGLSNNVLGFVSLEFDAQGINNNYLNSGVSALQAIAGGANAIMEGRADLAFAGGYDSVLVEESLVGLGRLGLLAKGNLEPARAHRPFDRGRSGLVPAEGACFLILEAAEHAAARGAKALGRIDGSGVASDAFAVTDPDPAGAKLCHAARMALAQAGVTPDEIDVIFAHANSSAAYDQVEVASYRRVFGERLSEIDLTADKAGFGHTMSACGAISVAVAVKSLHEGMLPPIATLDEVDPACLGPRFVLKARETDAQRALVSSAGLGGQAAAMVVSRVKEEV